MSKFLRRYTDLPTLIYLLRERKITLRNAEKWDDKNDSHYMSLYKQKKSLKSVVAVCFTQVSERYHHWRVFANGPSGVCVRFKRSVLTKAIKKQRGVRQESIRYLTLEDIKDKRAKINDLPLLKRYPYQDECEFRIIFESKTYEIDSLDIAFPIASIDRITLSPWSTLSMKSNLIKTIHNIPGCAEVDVFRSTLISNKRWKKWGDRA